MDELRRLNYLDAMGIEQWVARQALPFAKASEFGGLQDLSGPVLEEARDTQAPGTAADQAQDGQEPGLLDTGKSGEVRARQIDEETGEDSDNSPAKAGAVQQSMARAFVEVHGRKGLYVLLIEKHNEQLLTQEESRLLANLLRAIDSLFTDASACAQIRESFNWPMFGQQAQLQHMDVGEQAMEDALNAFVSALVKRHQQSLLLVLGDSLGERVRQPGGNMVLLSAPSLSSLLQDTPLKAALWHELLGALG